MLMDLRCCFFRSGLSRLKVPSRTFNVLVSFVFYFRVLHILIWYHFGSRDFQLDALLMWFACCFVQKKHDKNIGTLSQIAAFLVDTRHFIFLPLQTRHLLPFFIIYFL